MTDTEHAASGRDVALERLPLDAIRPYWRNPRRIPDEAITATADSISRYGYRQPIVVDGDHTVIVGHTRLAALRRLGWSEVPVLVADDLPADKVNEYRVMDNKVGDLTSWDEERLLHELREWTDTDLLDTYFDDVDLSIEFSQDSLRITAEDVSKATDRVQTIKHPTSEEQTPATLITVTCPHCFEDFDVDTQ